MEIKGNGKIAQWLKEVVEINNLIEMSYEISNEQGRTTEIHQTPFIKRRFKKIIEVLEQEDDVIMISDVTEIPVKQSSK